MPLHRIVVTRAPYKAIRHEKKSSESVPSSIFSLSIDPKLKEIGDIVKYPANRTVNRNCHWVRLVISWKMEILCCDFVVLVPVD